MHLTSEFIDKYHEAPDPAKYATTVARAERLLNIFWNLKVDGDEKVPLEGGGIIAFVHRSYKDPWMLGCAIPRFGAGFAKKELLRPYYLGLGTKYFKNRGFIFVDRKNPSRSDLEPLYQTIRDGKLVAIAPEGTSKNRGQKIGVMKEGIGRIAVRLASEEVDCSIIPVAIGSEGLHLSDDVPIIIGDSIHAGAGNLSTVSSRRAAAVEMNEQLSAVLQELNDRTWEVRNTS